jgi:hypothetical protein
VDGTAKPLPPWTIHENGTGADTVCDGRRPFASSVFSILQMGWLVSGNGAMGTGFPRSSARRGEMVPGRITYFTCGTRIPARRHLIRAVSQFEYAMPITAPITERR